MIGSGSKYHKVGLIAGMGAVVVSVSLYLASAQMPGKSIPMISGHRTEADIQTCAGLEVRSINVLHDLAQKDLHNPTPARIDIVPAQAPSSKIISLNILGPVLGSMDSPDLKTDLTCTPNGVALTAYISRSANFAGAALQNVNWRPEITVEVARREPKATLQITWRMLLTTGAELNHAQTPPYADQKYPIIMTKTIQ